MPNRIDALGVTALCAMLAVVVLPNNPARAAGDCLAAPDSQPPQGSHWYYRSDRGKQRHCWYLAPESQRVSHAKPDAQPEPRPVASASAQPSLPAPRPETAADPTQTLLQGLTYGLPRAATPSLAQRPDNEAAGAADREPSETSTVQYIQDEVAQPAEVAASGAMTMPTRVLLLVVCAVAIAGILQYTILRAVVVRRRRVSLERGRAKLSVSRWREREPPAVAGSRPRGLTPAPAEQIDPRDIQEGFRQILRAVERRAA